MGEVAIVTGGSLGIGRAVVEELLAHDAAVMFCARDASVGERVARELGESRSAIFAAADVTVEADVRELVQSCRQRLGAPTILINNAGRNASYDAIDMTTDQWEEFFSVDLRAAWLLAKHVLPLMRGNGGGAIVNISSIHASATAAGYFPYAAAKAGLLGLTRSLALDYARDNIRVNAIAPGFIDTPGLRRHLDGSRGSLDSLAAAVPLGRVGEAAEVATVACFLASSAASYVTGSCLVADGGLTARRAS
jgi:NAD(P)-dependent dehydrogenase (short-subunit alcohol dehydrogenase family)